MAHNSSSSLISLLLIFNIMLGIAHVSARQVPSSKNVDVKHPDWFVDPDGSVLIPGIGRVMIPSLSGGNSYSPYVGGTGGDNGVGDSGGNGNYIPGGDDTFVPNPGVEVPNPANGGVPIPANGGVPIPPYGGGNPAIGRP